jgi:hypothetical protein
MAKFITKAQLRQLYQVQLIDNDEYLRLLKEFAGIESRPTTEYNHYDENGEFIGSSVDTDLSDLLDEAGVEVREVVLMMRWLVVNHFPEFEGLLEPHCTKYGDCPEMKPCETGRRLQGGNDSGN